MEVSRIRRRQWTDDCLYLQAESLATCQDDMIQDKIIQARMEADETNDKMV